MKYSLLAVSLAALLSFVTPSGALASDTLSVSQIHTTTSNDLIWSNNAWRKDLPVRITATLHATKDTPTATAFVRAYFYDRDNNLIETLKAPSKVWTATERGYEEVGLPPAMIKAGQRAEVYFAIDENLQAKHWKSIVVVFGDGSQTVAHSYPADALQKVTFPEKSSIAPSMDGGL